MLEAHGPIGELALLDASIPQRDDIAMARISRNPLVQPTHFRTLPFERLQEAAALVEQHPGNARQLIPFPAPREQNGEVFG
jgi:hypothetical protein